MKTDPVRILVFHQNAHRHIDDASCLWLAKSWPQAETRFPGISTAEVIFDGTGGELYEGRSGDELLRNEQILCIGVCAGMFDAHHGPNNTGKPGCEFSLFCREIGIDKDPALMKIIEYVAESDRGNSGHPMSIGSIAKIMDRVWPDDPMAVFDWQIAALAAVYEQQKAFIAAQNEYEECATEKWIEGPDGRRILMAYMVSGNELMNDVARNRGASIVVQQRPADCQVLPGNIMVYTDRKARLSLAGVIAAIRQEEQRLAGVPVTTDSLVLRRPGKIEGVLNWYYLVGSSEMLLNGSWSAPDTPHSRVPLRVIVDIIPGNLESKAVLARAK